MPPNGRGGLRAAASLRVRRTGMLIREVCAAEETRVKFVNDLLDGEDEDDEF